jgi:hypothetical protein
MTMLGYIYSTMDYVVDAIHFVLLCATFMGGIWLWYNDTKQKTK